MALKVGDSWLEDVASVKREVQVEKDEGLEAETLSRQLIVAEGPN